MHSVSLEISDYNPSKHSGPYCWQFRVLINRSVCLIGACTMVIPKNHLLMPPRIQLETCNKATKLRENNIWPLYNSTSDCLTCTVTGMYNPRVRMYLVNARKGQKEIKTSTLRFDHLNMPYLKVTEYFVDDPTIDDAGIYTCVASDGDDVLSTSVTSILTDQLQIDIQVEGEEQVRISVITHCFMILPYFQARHARVNLALPTSINY